MNTACHRAGRLIWALHRMPMKQEAATNRKVRRARWLGEVSQTLEEATTIARRIDPQLLGNTDVRTLIARLNAAVEEVGRLQCNWSPEGEI